MLGRLRNMTSIYLVNDENMLLLYRQGGRVVNNVWTGSAGGYFEEAAKLLFFRTPETEFEPRIKRRNFKVVSNE